MLHTAVLRDTLTADHLVNTYTHFMKREDSYRVHTNLLLLPTLKPSYPVHAFQNYFLKMHFNTVLPSTPSDSPTKTLSAFFVSPTFYMPRPSHSS
jgi:hypothetical protein